MKYEEFEELVTGDLMHLRGCAYEAFRQSLVNDLIQRGYSDVRAEQVIDEIEVATKRSK